MAAAVVLAVAARPLLVGWRCYQLHATGEHTDAAVVQKDESLGLVLQIASGTQQGQTCTVRASEVQYEEIQPGQVLAVVVRSDRPGECVLVATLENSAALLWAVTGAVAVVFLLLVLLALFFQRTFTAAPSLTSHLDVDPNGVRCPRCGVPMGEGYLPLLAGLSWRGMGEPVGLPHALSGLPGTVGWGGRPRLHGFHCPACQVVTFKYGRRDPSRS